MSLIKGNITRSILAALKDVALTTADLFEVIVTSRYGASLGQLERQLSRRRSERAQRQITEAVEWREKERFYKMLYALRCDGLIQKQKQGSSTLFAITRKGQDKFTLMSKQEVLPRRNYTKKDGARLVIVMFDIPETEKRKRAWLRSVLKALGFRLVQKSVFLGKVEIPKEFLDDLRLLKLTDFVEIFTVDKSGSLRHIA